ncbi:uncharacterized protein LOC110651669 [Hevea brasiliensis]|uniref:uncharacterized protein LOC110651669 n=1 Tax=Hevea brasiliensis TaxID=3981 RepID=UPI002600D4CC|nr:uncharacterized protein LOC110651669 [Hevea brasiliensis]
MANNHAGVNLSQPSIPVFQGSNYDVWNGVAADNVRDLQKKDAKALFFIQQAIDEAIFPRIAAATKSKEAWDALQKIYEGTGKVVTVKLQTLRRKFESSVMKDEDSLSEYISNMIDVVNQIRRCGEILSEQKVIEKIVRSLPKKYEHVVAAIEESKDLEELTVAELQGSLFSHEERMKRYDNISIENAFYSKMQLSQGEKGVGGSSSKSNFNKGRGDLSRGRRGGIRGGPFYDSTGRGGNGYNQQPRSTDKGENRSQIQCYYCGKYGHLERFCRLKEKQANIAQEEEEDETESLFLACFSAKECPPAVWYIDSGCSNHMTSDLKHFTNLDESVTSRITMGDELYMLHKEKVL